MNQDSRKLLYVFEQAPYSNSAGQEALDAALIGASFEQHVSLLFIFDGVFQLKSQQSGGQKNSEASALKPYTNTFKALADFDIQDLFVHDLSALARGLSPSDLIVEARSIDTEGISALIERQDRVFTF